MPPFHPMFATLNEGLSSSGPRSASFHLIFSKDPHGIIQRIHAVGVRRTGLQFWFYLLVV